MSLLHFVLKANHAISTDNLDNIPQSVLLHRSIAVIFLASFSAGTAWTLTTNRESSNALSLFAFGAAMLVIGLLLTIGFKRLLNGLPPLAKPIINMSCLHVSSTVDPQISVPMNSVQNFSVRTPSEERKYKPGIQTRLRRSSNPETSSNRPSNSEVCARSSPRVREVNNLEQIRIRASADTYDDELSGQGCASPNVNQMRYSSIHSPSVKPGIQIPSPRPIVGAVTSPSYRSSLGPTSPMTRSGRSPTVHVFPMRTPKGTATDGRHQTFTTSDTSVSHSAPVLPKVEEEDFDSKNVVPRRRKDSEKSYDVAGMLKTRRTRHLQKYQTRMKLRMKIMISIAFTIPIAVAGVFTAMKVGVINLQSNMTYADCIESKYGGSNFVFFFEWFWFLKCFVAYCYLAYSWQRNDSNIPQLQVVSVWLYNKMNSHTLDRSNHQIMLWKLGAVRSK